MNLQKLTWRATILNSSFMIGNVRSLTEQVLAPMTGVIQLPFRTICKRVWCWSCGDGDDFWKKGLLYNNEKTLHMLHIDENEHLSSFSLVMLKEAERNGRLYRTNTKADIVDINIGCPVNKVVKKWSWCQVAQDPDKIYHIVKEVTSVLDIPLTVKMRTGWSDSDFGCGNALQLSSQLRSLLCTVVLEQMYTGHCDHETARAA